MSSTRSSESAFRSSTNEASGVTSASSTPSCSMTIFFSRSYVLATELLLDTGVSRRVASWSRATRPSTPFMSRRIGSPE